MGHLLTHSISACGLYFSLQQRKDSLLVESHPRQKPRKTASGILTSWCLSTYILGNWVVYLCYICLETKLLSLVHKEVNKQKTAAHAL